MANLDESSGQNVQEKSAHEFHGIDSGGLAVFGAKADVVAVEAHQPLIRDTDPVGIATEILKDVLGPATWSRQAAPSAGYDQNRAGCAQPTQAPGRTAPWDSAVPTRAVPGAV